MKILPTCREYLLKKLWPRHFARNKHAAFNVFLIELGLRGLGVLNYQNNTVSGEDWLVRTFLRRRLQAVSEPVIMDVGAHFGESSQSLREAFPAAKIMGFEPSPSAYAKAVEVLRSSSVQMYPLALSNAPGIVTIYDYASKEVGSQHSSLYPEVFDVIKKVESKATEVTAVTLDNFCREQKITRIDFLKIDAEGAELRILEGATEMISSGAIDVIQFEFNEMNIYSRVFLRDFSRILPGYTLHRLLPKGLQELSLSDSLVTNLYAFQNIVAFRR